ncbi:hypothetical protein ACJX0J_028397, partial [Zea mays]
MYTLGRACVLSACAQLCSLDVGTCNAFIDMFAKCGDVGAASSHGGLLGFFKRRLKDWQIKWGQKSKEESWIIVFTGLRNIQDEIRGQEIWSQFLDLVPDDKATIISVLILWFSSLTDQNECLQWIQYKFLYGDQARFFDDEIRPEIPLFEQFLCLKTIQGHKPHFELEIDHILNPIVIWQHDYVRLEDTWKKNEHFKSK